MEMLEDGILTIDEVANYLRVSERTVYDWAQRGEIPAGKIGTVWRFKRSELEKWVNDRLSSRKLGSSSSTVHLESILSPDRIIFLDFASKQDALLAMVDNLATSPRIKNRQELAQEIVKREELMSTAIGCGIAIPHVRLSSVSDLVVSVGISRTDIVGFQALDDEPVRMLFMIAAASSQHAYYLQTLSYFSSRFKKEELRTSLLSAQTADEAYRILVEM